MISTNTASAASGSWQLASITHADGEAYREHLRSRDLRPATIHKRLSHAPQALEDAVRLGHVPANPWKHVRQRQGDPSERWAYVQATDVDRAIEFAPNVWWKLLLAMSRDGGFRVPSEAFSLTWADVDWERGRVVVTSPKGKSRGKGHRVMPLLPAMRPYLERAFDAAEEGAVHVISEEWRKRAMGPAGWKNANLRTTQFLILRKAGVEPWPRL